MSDRKEMTSGGTLRHLIKHADARFMGALGSRKVAVWGPANRAHRCSLFGLSLLRLGRPLAQSIHCDSSQPSAFSFPALCPDAHGKIVCLLTGFFGRLEGVSSPLVADPSPPNELAAGCAAIAADSVVLSRLVSSAKRVLLALTLRWSWRVQLLQFGRSFYTN